MHFEYFWNSKPVVSPNLRPNFVTWIEIRACYNISFLCGGNLSLGFYIFFYMYTCHLNLFNHNFTAAARHASACGLATNVQTSMRNVKLYWINIDIFCVEHLKPIVFCYSLCLVHERTQHDIQYCKFHCLVLALLIALHGLFYLFFMHWKCFCKVTISSSDHLIILNCCLY